MCRLDDHLYKKISIPGLCVFSTHQLNVDISCQQIQNKSTQITKLWDKKVPFLQICGLFLQDGDASVVLASQNVAVLLNRVK